MLAGMIRKLAFLALVGAVLEVGAAHPVHAGPGVSVYLPAVFTTGAQATSQAKPVTDWSFYISTTDPSVAYTLGCNQGSFDANFTPSMNSMVVLDFGGQLSDGSGTLLINGVSVTNAQIEAVAEAFSHGYWYCTGTADLTSTLSLVIGTNNSYYDVGTSGGSTWAGVVAAVAAYNQAQGYNSQVIVDGGNDIEPGWNDPASSEAWANGYAANATSFYVNYGTADGCPSDNASDAACDNGWTQYDVWYVSWGAGPARSVPEIYYDVNASQWAMIALYGDQTRGTGGKILFSGPMDEYPLWNNSNSSAQSWEQLWTALNENPATAQPMPYSLEMHNEQ